MSQSGLVVDLDCWFCAKISHREGAQGPFNRALLLLLLFSLASGGALVTLAPLPVQPSSLLNVVDISLYIQAIHSLTRTPAVTDASTTPATTSFAKLAGSLVKNKK